MENNNFFSLDKLLEFGLSMEMAKQMMSIMNTSFKSIQMPGSQMPDGSTVSKNFNEMPVSYYAVIEGKSAGPFSEAELSKLIETKKINNKTYIWRPGFSNWKAAEDVPEILKLVSLVPPPLPKT